MFSEVKKSLEKNLDEKLVSPFWGALIISWIIWNWKAWFILFFIDSNLLMQSKGLLKIEYILNFYPLNHLLAIVYSVSFPLLFSYFAVFWLPKITRLYYSKALDFEYENKIIKERKEEKYFSARGSKLMKEKEVLETEKEVEEIKSERSQDELWTEEYSSFMKSRYFQYMYQLKKCIYQKGGDTREFIGTVTQDILLPDFKAFLDTNKIIELINNPSSRERAILTEKGKYFMKKYTETS